MIPRTSSISRVVKGPMPPLPSPVLSGTGTPPIISVSLGTAEDLATAIPYRPDLPTGHYARHFAGLAQGGGAAAEAKMGNDEGDEGYAVSKLIERGRGRAVVGGRRSFLSIEQGIGFRAVARRSSFEKGARTL